jgi:glutathione S-transferase
MRKTFDYMNRQLQGQKYMCGDDMTIVDISMATNLALIELRNYKLDNWSQLSIWFQRMKSLPYWAECNAGLYEWKSPMLE